ncbi:MAG: DUF2238 domain-containing protein, partial [Gammaproteobacteria bacterium]|nr:DUF2238 domain-containing protein [Gammaproteobacteria bacterium]
MQVLWIVIFTAVLIWSGYQPKDVPTWFLEVSPALIGAAILAMTRCRFPLTPMAYALVL